jgi:L-amino acid N-acyltransferase
MRIAPGAAEHIPAITAIYNDAVLTSTAIWNDSVVDVADRLRWLEARERDGFPVIVALDDDADGGDGSGDAVGFATFGPFRPHDGYRHTVELSVYVRGDQRGRGVGRMLVEALIALARQRGAHVMVAAIESGNAASIRLHERLGFERAGTLRQVGAKFGTWLDLVLLQLALDDEPLPR